MEYEYILVPEDELYHHGVKGMKWGVRLYQRKDGSLTALGKKRRAREDAQLKERERRVKNLEKAKARQAKVDAKKADLDAREQALKGSKKFLKKNKPDEKDSNPDGAKKSVKDMSIEELRAHTDRMNAEKNYYEAQKNLANAMPAKVNKGKTYAEAFLNDAIMPAVKSSAKQWLEKTLKDKFGLSDSDVSRTLTLTEALANEAKLSDAQIKAAYERASNLRKMRALADNEAQSNTVGKQGANKNPKGAKDDSDAKVNNSKTSNSTNTTTNSSSNNTSNSGTNTNVSGGSNKTKGDANDFGSSKTTSGKSWVSQSPVLGSTASQRTSSVDDDVFELLDKNGKRIFSFS